MEAILELQNILIRNYYPEFIISLENGELNFDSYHYEIVSYRGKDYLEKNLIKIEEEIGYILDDIKPVYLKCLTEVLLKLSDNSKPSEKINYLNHIIKLLKIPVNQLKKDFYITDFESRYFSKASEFDNLKSIDEIADKIVNDLKLKEEEVFGGLESDYQYSKYDMFELEYANIRMKIISRLPLALFTIASSFINILHNKIDEINVELHNKEAINEKIEWSGKPSQLGFIFSKLAELDYIVPPKRDNGETNYTQFAKKIINIFKIKTTEGTLAKYLNSNESKAQETQRNFDKVNFNIPHKKEVS